MTTTELTTIPFQSHNHDAGKGQNETEVMQPTHDLYKTLNQCCLIMMGIGAIRLVDTLSIIVTDKVLMPETINTVLSYASTGVMLACIITYCRFMGRAMSNVHAVRGSDGLMSPRAVWLWCFAPIFSLWKPYVGVRQILTAGSDSGQIDAETDNNMKIWWYCWAGSGVLSVLALGWITDASMNELITEAQLLSGVAKCGVIINALQLVAFYSFTKLAERIDEDQAALVSGGIAREFA